MSEAKPGRRDRRRPDLDTVYTINADGSRNFLHPADVRGPWQLRKNLIWALLIAVYVLMPWIELGGKPLIHLDLPGRAAHLFGQTFTNQDFYLAFFLITGMGFGLFVLTSLWGRIWCGYACPQTVFMEGIMRRLERWIEGPRAQRIRRNLGPWTGDKVWRKGLKHALFLVLSYLIAHVFLSYFIPVRELLKVVQESPAAHRSAFGWSMFWTAVLYFNYAWFREQTCLIVCPYGRLQSTLVDDDTVVIGYDAGRGEPRHKGVGEGGDCIDCFRCVEVCPTGIDIRNGLQMECIGCANCIDACDDVMTRTDRPRGLVRYDSQRGFAGQRRRLLRPRVYVYAVLGLAGLAAFGFKAAGREPFQANLLRTSGLPFAIEGESLRNLYTLHIQNKTDAPHRYRIEPAPGAPASLSFIIPQAELTLGPLEDAELPLFATLPRAEYREAFDFALLVTELESGNQRRLALRFRGP
ncbi:cytochrome c oxidase accessory protein CcoG [bacterium]|nr:cytochrome c oxidase accessory protein CcoG [bacterium]